MKFELIKKGLIVSCQPNSIEDTFYDIKFINRMCLAAQSGNAVALRVEGVENIRQLSKKIKLPIIALVKRCSPIDCMSTRCITPDIKDIIKLYQSGAKIIAVDFTLRDSADIKFYTNIMHEVTKLDNLKIIADVSSIEEALLAQDCGVSYISSTLTGYTSITNNIPLPNIDIIKEFKKNIKIPYFAEGGYSSFESIKNAFDYGAHCVVIGTAITRPNIITRKYSRFIEKVIYENN